MVSCDQQEKVSSIQNVLPWIFLEIRYFIWRYAVINRLLVGSSLIPLNIKLEQDDRTDCCNQKIVMHKVLLPRTCLVFTLPESEHNFQTIQKVQSHGSGNKLFMLNTLLTHKILQKLILRTYMGIPHILRSYCFFLSAPSHTPSSLLPPFIVGSAIQGTGLNWVGLSLAIITIFPLRISSVNGEKV